MRLVKAATAAPHAKFYNLSTGYIPPNNLTASPPTPQLFDYGLHLHPPPPIIWLWSASELWIILALFLVFTWFRGQKLQFSVKTFFFGLHLFYLREKNRCRASSPPMFKIGQNWGKLAIYPPMLNINQHHWQQAVHSGAVQPVRAIRFLNLKNRLFAPITCVLGSSEPVSKFRETVTDPIRAKFNQHHWLYVFSDYLQTCSSMHSKEH